VCLGLPAFDPGDDAKSMEKRRFTRKELARYNGRDDAPAFLACEGLVYDVSGSFLWQQGRHQVLHAAGDDLTDELAQAPHGADLLQKFPVVGVLVDE
jgi:predicted heme/steroid binding protein